MNDNSFKMMLEWNAEGRRTITREQCLGWREEIVKRAHRRRCKGYNNYEKQNFVGLKANYCTVEKFQLKKIKHYEHREKAQDFYLGLRLA